MNIFYLDRDPVKAAQVQYNKHVVKMILESAQMLCTAHRYYGNENVPYKSAHINHPSSIWCRDCLLYTSPSPRDVEESRMPSSA